MSTAISSRILSYVCLWWLVCVGQDFTFALAVRADHVLTRQTEYIMAFGGFIAFLLISVLAKREEEL